MILLCRGAERLEKYVIITTTLRLKKKKKKQNETNTELDLVWS